MILRNVGLKAGLPRKGHILGYALTLLEWTVRSPLYLGAAICLVVVVGVCALLPLPLEGAYEFEPATYTDEEYLGVLESKYGVEARQYALAVQVQTNAGALMALSDLFAYEAAVGRDGAAQLAWLANSIACLEVPEMFSVTNEAPALFLIAWVLGGGVPYVFWFMPAAAAVAALAVLTGRGTVLGRAPVAARTSILIACACVAITGAIAVLVGVGIAFVAGLLHAGLGDAAYPVMVGASRQTTLGGALEGSAVLLVGSLLAVSVLGASVVGLTRSLPASMGVFGTLLVLPMVLAGTGLVDALSGIVAHCPFFYLDFGKVTGMPGYSVPQEIPASATAYRGAVLQLLTCVVVAGVVFAALGIRSALVRRGSKIGDACHNAGSGDLFGCSCMASAGTHTVDADISLMAGEVCVFRAPNGTGKTTLLRALCADPVGRMRGSVQVKGVQIADAARYRSLVAYASNDDSGLCPWMTVEGLVRAIRRIWPRANGVERVELCFGLSMFEHKTVRALSSGMRQRVVLACAFQTGAACLLLDEPTSSLDVIAADEVNGLIDDFAAHGGCVVLASHGERFDSSWNVISPVALGAHGERALFRFP